MFEFYDQNDAGCIDYKAFVKNLVSTKKSPQAVQRGMTPVEQSAYGSRPNSRAQSVRGFQTGQNDVRPHKNVDERQVKNTLDNIREQLLKKGLFSLIHFGKNLKVFIFLIQIIAHLSSGRTINIKELAKSLYEFNIKIDEREIMDLFDYLDHTRQGHIGIDPLLELIRGPMNDFRRSVIGQVFAKLDFEGKGFLNIDDFPFYYSTRHHPLVVSGAKKETQITDELVQSFQDYLSILVDLDD